MSSRKSFVMYTTWASIIAKLPDDQAAQLIKAISCYQIGEEYEVKDPAVKAMFEAMIVPKFQEDESKYQKKVDSIQNARDSIQSDNSLKSDSKQSEISLKSDSKQSEISSVTDTDTVTVNDTETDTDKSKEKMSPTGTEKRSGRPAESAHARKKPERHRYGEYNHVLLSDADFSRLCDKHGEKETLAAIKAVDEYCEQSGRTYKNYALAMEKWGYKSTREQKARSGTTRSYRNDTAEGFNATIDMLDSWMKGGQNDERNVAQYGGHLQGSIPEG